MHTDGPNMVSGLTPTSVVAEPHVHVISDVREWEELAQKWSDLFDASPTASPPLRYEWMRQWWEEYGEKYGEGGTGLRIITIQREGTLLGVLPLYRQVVRDLVSIRRLQFLSTGEDEIEETCPMYLDLLHRQGAERECLDAVAATLREMEWDELELRDIRADSPLMGLAPRLADQAKLVTEPRGDSYVCDLTDGFDRYRDEMSPSMRKQIRRLMNAAERHGAKLELAGDAQAIEEFYNQLVELHQARWRLAGRPGCFACERFTRFHRALAGRLVPEGKAVLARLLLDERALVVIYGMVHNGKMDCYLQGAVIDDSTGIRSPGTAAHLLLKQRFAESGIRQYDYLAGSGGGSYKECFGKQGVPVVSLHASRSSVKHAVQAAVKLVRRVSRRGLRLLHVNSVSPHEARPEGE